MSTEPHTTFENKKIVYSDTILPLKDIGNNLRIKTIENVSKTDLKYCLEIIFISNPDVVFNTIQYSTKDERVYFYTNKEIFTEVWKRLQLSKPVNIKTQILQEIKRILTSDENKDYNCISLYDVYKLIRKINKEKIKKERYYMDIIEKNYKYYHTYDIYDMYDIYSLILTFDYNKDELEILVGSKPITFSKNYGKLYLKSDKSNTSLGIKLLMECRDVLSAAYDELLMYTNIRRDSSCVKPLDSIFSAYIFSSAVEIYIRSWEKDSCTEEFNLTKYNISKDKECFCYCNSHEILNVVCGQENEIFKKLFVRIDDCPYWSRESLYEIRKKQLDEEKQKLLEEKIAEEQELLERKKKEEKYQKRLNLKRRIFPFLKK